MRVFIDRILSIKKEESNRPVGEESKRAAAIRFLYAFSICITGIHAPILIIYKCFDLSNLFLALTRNSRPLDKDTCHDVYSNKYYYAKFDSYHCRDLVNRMALSMVRM